jgi:hypothetical protein
MYLLSKEQEDEECDTIADAQRFAAGKQKIILLTSHSVAWETAPCSQL